MASIYETLFGNPHSVDQATLHQIIHQNGKTPACANAVSRAIQSDDTDYDQTIQFGERPFQFNKAPDDCRAALIEIINKNREAKGITTGSEGIFSFTDEEIIAASKELQRQYPDKTTSI